MNAVTITSIKSKKQVFIPVGRVYKNLTEKVKLQLDVEDQRKVVPSSVDGRRVM